MNRKVARSFVDAAPQVVLRFELRLLCCNEAQNHILSTRNQAQRLESSGTMRIVFEEKCVHVQRSNEPFCNHVVTTLSKPAAPAISSADVRCNRDAVSRNPRQTGVVAFDCSSEFLVRISAAGLHLLAMAV